MPNKVDITGQRFGRLVAVREVARRKANRRWECRCDCGSVVEVFQNSLTGGATRSCGCLSTETKRALKTTHGRSGTPLFHAWPAMIQRCENAKNDAYHNYGGRGIRVCKRWESFKKFLFDMGECPPGLSLDREDNDGNYNKKNCRWATRQEQNRNKRTSRVIAFNGVTKNLTDWARDLGMDQSSLRERLEKWPVDRALTTPKRELRAGTHG